MILFDRDGVRMALNWIDLIEDGSLYFDVLVENSTGREICIYVKDSYVDGVEMDGFDLYPVPDGKTFWNSFTLKPLEGQEELYGDILKNPREFSFTFEVWDTEAHETMFLQAVSLVAE
ncbi:MAG: hypothetical protein GX647_10425 [Clostridiales bacterium]|jgi:hypothetical protein|nr:hypothetical protein [Clostridiales bacterium]OPZ66977.1 MAG: hypothetical protein BWY81_01554 [Firmicutes bacterium ADurb.Bin467]